MIDFGLSKHFYVGELHTEAVGTPYTVAPEVIRGGYDERGDIWAMGVITYLLLSGETPFGGCDGEDLLQVKTRILSGRVVFEPPEIWEHVSDMAKEFVLTLLKVDPSERPTAKEAQRSKWIQTWSKKVGTNHNGQLNPNVVKALVSFKESSDLKKVLSEVISFTLLPEQISDLRAEFEKLDNGKGEISLYGLKKVLLESAEAGSLGALTEDEIDDIFNSLRLRKTETKIRWHEFIAAGLSQCKIDDRNLKLAFDRLDTDRKGYITFDNLVDLMGENCENADELRRMWMSSLQRTKGVCDQITCEDFLVLMKGQVMAPDGSRRISMGSPVLHAVPEGKPSPTPARITKDIDFLDAGLSECPSLPTLEEGKAGADTMIMPIRPMHGRHRSRSFEHRTEDYFGELGDDSGKLAARPSILGGRSTRAFENVAHDESKTPLMVNKALYRAHREMRLAVLQLSQRFEEEQARRRTKTLAEQGREVDPRTKGAALIASRKNIPVSLPPRPDVDDLYQQELKNAIKRGGRARGKRKKTVSDMSLMMSVKDSGV
jgi:Ca2+-binding EF-hand superfamily protein